MKLRLFQVLETKMAPLNERQKKAAAVAQEITRLGGHVVSPMPLRDDDKELRIQILDKDKHIVQAIQDWGWTPTYGGPLPRVTFTGFEPATIYKIEIPIERRLPAVPERHSGELADKKPLHPEVIGMRKYLGMK
jgi:hypothetical protein